MIPRTLQLKNFLSYGPELQTIDFTSHHLICLSGKNGHGKSALLDAITWAIWGYARKIADTSKADEGLLRLGQTNMLVMLDFDFNGNTYRVRREFSKAYGKASTALDFGIVNKDTDNIVSLTEKTIRATQQKIHTMLNLDADSFINSAFLRQGQSNEFSKKSAKERKEILATILGLDRYETIRKAAVEKAKQANNQKQAVQTLQTALETELAAAPTLRTQLASLQQQLDSITAQEQLIATKKQALETTQQELVAKRQQFTLLTQQQEHCIKSYEQGIAALHQQRQVWKTTHHNLLQQPEYGHLETQKKQLLHTIASCQQQLQETLTIKESILQHKEQLHALETAARREHEQQLQVQQRIIQAATLEQSACAKKITELEEALLTIQKDQQNAQEELATIKSQLIAVKKAQTHWPQEEKQFEKRKAFYQTYIAQGNSVKRELQELEQKNKLVLHDEHPSCPLCEQNLSASRKKFIKTSFAKQESFLQHRLRRLAMLISSLKQLLIEQHERIKAITQEKEQLVKLKLKEQDLHSQAEKNGLQLTALQHDITVAQQQHAVQTNLIATHRATEQSLTQQAQQLMTQHAIYVTVKSSLDALMQKSVQTSYNQQEHQTATKELEQVEKQLHAIAENKRQETLQQERAERITQQCVQLKLISQERTMLAAQLTTFATLESQEQALIATRQSIDIEAETLQRTKETALQEKGKLESSLATIEKQEAEFKKNAAHLIELCSTVEDYQSIAVATSKDGIQALLIEDALPEIEHEANQLLAKLTHNQAHIIIESLRDLKKGGAKETLDIKISDPVGIRPYEMFSGGEAFRIDVALRIAISKLLARRAGTSLQTLIIDEGFGSQDDEGLSHIMDVLYAIQEDFSKIIIVSHLPMMKDQFPVHFYVEKGPNGSRVQVIEQG